MHEDAPDVVMETPAVESLTPLPQLKVKSLQTSLASVSSTSKFLPKFEKQQLKVATVISAPQNTDCQGWKSMQDTISVSNMNQAPVAPNVDSAIGADVLNEDGSMYMFWIDAFERNGVIYLFGKVFSRGQAKNLSCCVAVHNVQRNLFVLPRLKKLDGIVIVIQLKGTKLICRLKWAMSIKNLIHFAESITLAHSYQRSFLESMHSSLQMCLLNRTT